MAGPNLSNWFPDTIDYFPRIKRIKGWLDSRDYQGSASGRTRDREEDERNRSSGSSGGRARSGGGQPNPSNLWTQAQGMIGQTVQNPYEQAMNQWYSTVMAPGYQAIPQTELDKIYGQGESKLKEGLFNQWEASEGRGQANRNLTGSGVGGINWGKVLGKEGGALADLYNETQQYGRDATRSDVSQAVGAYPGMSSLNLTYGNQDWDRLMQYLQAQLQKEGAAAPGQAANASGIASIIAALVGAFGGE